MFCGSSRDNRTISKNNKKICKYVESDSVESVFSQLLDTDDKTIKKLVEFNNKHNKLMLHPEKYTLFSYDGVKSNLDDVNTVQIYSGELIFDGTSISISCLEDNDIESFENRIIDGLSNLNLFFRKPKVQKKNMVEPIKFKNIEIDPMVFIGVNSKETFKITIPDLFEYFITNRVIKTKSEQNENYKRLGKVADFISWIVSNDKKKYEDFSKKIFHNNSNYIKSREFLIARLCNIIKRKDENIQKLYDKYNDRIKEINNDDKLLNELTTKYNKEEELKLNNREPQVVEMICHLMNNVKEFSEDPEFFKKFIELSRNRSLDDIVKGYSDNIRWLRPERWDDLLKIAEIEQVMKR